MVSSATQDVEDVFKLPGEASASSSVTRSLGRGLDAKQADAVDKETKPRAWDPRARASRKVKENFPKGSARIRKVALYIRGPSPRISLPGPKPLLNLDFQTGRFSRLRFLRRLEVPLETWFIQWTRFFAKTWLLLLLGAAYIVALAFLVRAQWFLVPADSFLACTAAYWAREDGCGLNGEECAPFDNVTFDFRCPSGCASVILENPRAVGAESVSFVPLIVGGGDSGNFSSGVYRGDSFVCAAAAHAGVIEESKGGCASLALVGTQGPFESFTAHGLTSTAFPSFFPLSLQFSSTTPLRHCSDLRNWALVFNILSSCLLFLLLRPKPLVLYWCLVCIGYWHVIFFSQPAGALPSISNAFGTFLPALFICRVLWELAWRHVLPFFSAMPLERAVWYLGAFWPGVLYNIITAGIPIDRLLSSDITKRRGAAAALSVIATVVTILVVNQLRVIRKTGWLLYYMAGYAVIGLIIMVLALLPSLQFRLHHYIAAILIMPLTAFPTRLSAIYQAFLLGMFLNGSAAFGLASILETAKQLQRDAAAGTTLPTFLTNSSVYNSSIPLANQTLRWDTLPPGNPDGWNGFALLVDDVERYVGTALNFSLAGLNASVPHFFRLAFQQDGTSGDFTKAATLWPNGSWVDPKPGPS